MRIKERRPVALLVSDIHLSHTPPVARAAEPDWYEAMRRQLAEISAVAAHLNVPILCAGDIFHVWDSPAQLINFAINHMPKMIAIPGQHDLPNHNYNLMHKSAYYTLVAAGVLVDITYRRGMWCDDNISVTAFPWGMEVRPLSFEDYESHKVNIALAHSYVWSNKHNKHPRATDNTGLKRTLETCGGFDIAVFGDNHNGFIEHNKKPILVNCGGVMRRRVDEIDREPFMTVVYSDRTVEAQYYETYCMDCFTEDVTKRSDDLRVVGFDGFDGRDFLLGLESLSELGVDFKEIATHALEDANLTKDAKEIIRKALHDKR